MPYLLMFLGAGFGGMLRYAVNVLAMRHMMLGGVSLGTLAINVVGSLAMGLVAGFFARRGPAFAPEARLFLTSGILGGFTTFSAFSLETMLLIERGDVGPGLAYVGASVLGSVLACAAGLWLIRSLAGLAV